MFFVFFENESCHFVHLLRKVVGLPPAYTPFIWKWRQAKIFFEKNLPRVFACIKNVVSLQRQNKNNGLWCNGNTTDSGPVILGSNPGSPAIKKEYISRCVPFFINGCFQTGARQGGLSLCYFCKSTPIAGQSEIDGHAAWGSGDQTGLPCIQGRWNIHCRRAFQVGLRFDKMSDEGSDSAVPRTKMRFGGFRGILRRFVKYTLLLYGKLFFLFAKVACRGAAPCYSSFLNTPLFITFRFVDRAHLLESETYFFLLPSSKDLTSGHETIVFGR